MDLTTLSGDDTPGRVKRLCAKARYPVRHDILEKLDALDLNLHVAAVCVYHNMVECALEALGSSNIPVAAVSTGFPAGQTTLAIKIQEIKTSIEAGAQEIDVVISRSSVIRGEWEELYNEISEFRKACGSKILKSIIATGELPTFRHIAQASLTCMMAGSDFIKTSTGKEKINATLPVGLVMVRAIRDYYNQTPSYQVGLKPAGGISTAKQALEWMLLVKEELGNDWLQPSLFRIGASSLLADIERQLEHFTSGGHYAAYHHQPLT
jgi:deoxyribose-phosphate aldolase